MAVENVKLTCDGYSGSAAEFVTLVEVRVDGQVVASLPSPGQFAGTLELQGEHVVEMWDRTTGNDYDAANGTTDHGGPGSYLVVRLELSFPNLESLTTIPSSVPAPVSTLPVPALVVEPSVPTTLVELSTVAPSTTNYAGLDDFYVAHYEPEGEPVGCCADYVAETVAQTSNTLPATGAATAPMLAGGALSMLLGVVCALVAVRWPRRVQV